MKPVGELSHAARRRRLKETLDGLEVSAPLNDPVEYIRGFGSRENAEIGGFIVSAIAYGKIDQIMNDTRRLLDITGDRPAGFVRNFSKKRVDGLAGFTHRFTRGTHIACLIVRLKYALRDHGSLHALFYQAWARSRDMRAAISDFVENLRSYDCPRFCDDCATPRRQSVRWLLSDPRNGSAAKRMCLYLRWMVRDIYPDLGMWNGVPKSALVIPLDTHVVRIGRLLGFTRRRSADWDMALEITGSLKQLDPEDPLRYDYPLSHLGIDGRCSGKRNVVECAVCKVREFCCEVAARSVPS